MPKDLSVVGFDDVLPARFIVPALTTVRQDATGLLERAVQAIVSPEGRPTTHVRPTGVARHPGVDRNATEEFGGIEEEEPWSE